MKFKNKWLKEIIGEDWSKGNPLEYVESTGWVGDGGKYENRETVFKYEGKYYVVYDYRSGSYYSFYYYDSEDWNDEGEQDCKEVEKVAITKYEWHPVKTN